MANKAKIYLETSVISAYFDFKNQDPERQAVTQRFWREVLPDYESFVSETVIAEIAKDAAHASQQMELVKTAKSKDVTSEINALAHDYLAAGVIRPTKLADALHLAVATASGIDYLVSWNYRDLARPAQQRKILDYHKTHGLYAPTIATPDDFFEK